MSLAVRRHLTPLVVVMAGCLLGAAPAASAPRGDEFLQVAEVGTAVASAGVEAEELSPFDISVPAAVSASETNSSATLTTSLVFDGSGGPPGLLTWRVVGTVSLATTNEEPEGRAAADASFGIGIPADLDAQAIPVIVEGTYSLVTTGPACASVAAVVSSRVCSGESDSGAVFVEGNLSEDLGSSPSAGIGVSTGDVARAGMSATATIDLTITIGVGDLGCDIVGSGDDDVLEGTAGDDVICGFGGDDTLRGFGGDDTLVGGDGVDTLVGFDGDDTLLGGPGPDVLFGDDGSDLSLGGPGDDRITESPTSTGDDTMFGCSGFDTIVGGRGDDTLGDAPPFPDSDLAIGEITMADIGCDTPGTELAGDTIFAGPGSDTISGGASRDEIYGGSGSDTIGGGAQRDTLVGCAGKDDIDGGGGADDLLGEAVVTDEEIAAANDLTVDDVDCSPVEPGRSPNVLAGGSGDDELTGGEGPDRITGGKGSDKLRGLEGNDRLAGNQGFDIHLGASGRDTILANDGSRDRVNGGPGRDKANTDPVDQVTSIEITLRSVR